MPVWSHCKANGPATWGRHWPIADHPKHGQSPIDIETTKVTEAPDRWRPLVMKYPQTPWTFLNNGHFFQIDIEEGEKTNHLNLLRDGPLSADYRLAQFHFHWNETDEHGTEHTIDGQSYAAECHLLHYDAKRYTSWEDAVCHKNGLAVLAVLFKLGKANQFVQKFIDRFDDIRYNGDRIDWPGTFNVQWLLPNDCENYWYYYGALTGPPLGESVNWIIFKEILELSTEQLSTFRGLYTIGRTDTPADEFSGLMMCNIRPIQPTCFTTTDENGEEKQVIRQVYSQKRKNKT